MVGNRRASADVYAKVSIGRRQNSRNIYRGRGSRRSSTAAVSCDALWWSDHAAVSDECGGCAKCGSTTEDTGWFRSTGVEALPWAKDGMRERCACIYIVV